MSLEYHYNYKENVFDIFSRRNKKNNTFYMFLDESEIERKLKLCGMLLTPDMNKTISLVRNFRSYLSKKLPRTRCHFTDILSKDSELLKKFLTKLNSLDFIFDISFVRCGKDAIKLSQFISFFECFVDTNFWGKNIHLYCDKAYAGNIDFSQVFFFAKRHDTGILGVLVPNNEKFMHRIKKEVRKCDVFQPFPISLINMEQNEGLVLCDFLVGSVRQAIKGNEVFLDIVRDKFLRKDIIVEFEDILINF